MTAPMSLARFEELAAAYGGVIERWPEPCRAAARVAAQTPAAAAILAQAGLLDATLDAWRVPAPSARLREAIARGMPDCVADRRIVRRARLWWSGIGVAAALAGATAGVAAVARLAPADLSDGTTSFGDLGAQEG